MMDMPSRFFKFFAIMAPTRCDFACFCIPLARVKRLTIFLIRSRWLSKPRRLGTSSCSTCSIRIRGLIPVTKRRRKRGVSRIFTLSPVKCATIRRKTVKVFSDAGAAPDLVQVGNEINNGVLWPLGSFNDKPESMAYDNIAALLNAGIEGVHQAAPKARIIIHAANGERTERVRHFFDELTRRRVAFDIVGLSYYPLRGSLEQIAGTLNSAAKAYGKPVLIVETAAPWRESLQRGRPEASLAWPQTLGGQKAYLLDLIKTLHAVPDGLGAGFFYWHPDAVRAKGLPLWRGGDMALFDDSDNTLPALGAFQSQP